MTVQIGANYNDGGHARRTISCRTVSLDGVTAGYYDASYGLTRRVLLIPVEASINTTDLIISHHKLNPACTALVKLPRACWHTL